MFVVVQILDLAGRVKGGGGMQDNKYSAVDREGGDDSSSFEFEPEPEPEPIPVKAEVEISSLVPASPVTPMQDQPQPEPDPPSSPKPKDVDLGEDYNYKGYKEQLCCWGLFCCFNDCYTITSLREQLAELDSVRDILLHGSPDMLLRLLSFAAHEDTLKMFYNKKLRKWLEAKIMFLKHHGYDLLLDQGLQQKMEWPATDQQQPGDGHWMGLSMEESGTTMRTPGTPQPPRTMSPPSQKKWDTTYKYLDESGESGESDAYEMPTPPSASQRTARNEQTAKNQKKIYGTLRHIHSVAERWARPSYASLHLIDMERCRIYNEIEERESRSNRLFLGVLTLLWSFLNWLAIEDMGLDEVLKMWLHHRHDSTSGSD